MKLFRLIIKESHRVLILSYQRLLASILLTTIILTTAFAQDRLVPKSPIDDLASPYYRTLLRGWFWEERRNWLAYSIIS